MIRRSVTIGSGQLVLLLAVFRVFDLLTYGTSADGIENGATVLASIVPQLVLLGVVLIPAGLLMARFGGCNVIMCAMRLARPVGLVLAATLGLLFIAVAGDTVSNFELLLTGSVYPDSSSWFFIITMVLVCTYAVFLGLEPVARVNTFVFFALVAVIAFLAVAILPKADMVYLYQPFYNEARPFWRNVVGMCFANFDVLVWLVITPHLRGVPAKSFGWWLLTTAFLYASLIFLITVGLGDYAATQPFPFLALASVAELSVFQRLDSLHLTLWTFLAFIKVSGLLFLAAQCFGNLLPLRAQKANYIACGVVTAAVAGVLSAAPRNLAWMRQLLRSGVTVAVLAVLVPLVLLLWAFAAKKKGATV